MIKLNALACVMLCGHNNFSRVGQLLSKIIIIIEYILDDRSSRRLVHNARNDRTTGNIAGVMMFNYKTHVLIATFLASRFRPNVFSVHDSGHSRPWNV